MPEWVVMFFAVLGMWLVGGLAAYFIVVEVCRLLNPWATRRLEQQLGLDVFDWSWHEREFEDVA